MSISVKQDLVLNDLTNLKQTELITTDGYIWYTYTVGIFDVPIQ